jgi:glucose/mannose transport system substrate-binding protein
MNSSYGMPARYLKSIIRDSRLSTALVGVFMCAAASAADKPEAEILHWWATPGESAALEVFVSAYEGRNGLFYNSTAADQRNNREQAIERMAKGYAPTLTQWNAGEDVRSFYDLGLIEPISDPGLVDRLQTTLPPAVLEAVSHKEQIIAMPVNIHSENWMWYSQDRIQYDDKMLSGQWQGLLEQGVRLAQDGIPLLAVGDQPWQVRILFTSLLLAVSRDTYKQFYLATDAKATQRDEFREALVLFNKLAKFSRSFGDGNWDTQVKAVSENAAGAVFMGDWAKGEFKMQGASLGTDFGCALGAANDPSLLLVIDTFILGKVSDVLEQSGQSLMLDIVSTPDINQSFNLRKGSLSPYGKPPTTQLDECSQQAYRVLEVQDAVIPPYATYQYGAAIHEIDQELYRFWNSSIDGSGDKTLIASSIDTFNSILVNKQSLQEKKK